MEWTADESGRESVLPLTRQSETIDNAAEVALDTAPGVLVLRFDGFLILSWRCVAWCDIPSRSHEDEVIFSCIYNC
ncbi:hypothetical protein E2562_021973 [Oryza meyeriana var. granulata]|uniref:Uncharacterized protein n=1 Tax=Oryza meyeriana var. granulata TaxID=110450 RepID=A0A6G1DMK4_9ORYZ|nr:hypothetical protein E2562_021973 [Oryza meyeriana var. granulata]